MGMIGKTRQSPRVIGVVELFSQSSNQLSSLLDTNNLRSSGDDLRERERESISDSK